MSWLINYVFPAIRDTLLYLVNAKDVWDDLRIQYACSDGPHVFHLEKSLSSIRQGTQSVTVYYNAFKGLWDEFLSFRTLPQCSCGVMCNCACNIHSQLLITQNLDCAVKFFVGLHESYAHMRSQLLLSSPLPPISKIYYVLLQEENQRRLSCDVVESVAMYSGPGTSQPSVAMYSDNGSSL